MNVTPRLFPGIRALSMLEYQDSAFGESVCDRCRYAPLVGRRQKDEYSCAKNCVEYAGKRLALKI